MMMSEDNPIKREREDGDGAVNDGDDEGDDAAMHADKRQKTAGEANMQQERHANNSSPISSPMLGSPRSRGVRLDYSGFHSHAPLRLFSSDPVLICSRKSPGW